MNNPIAGTYCVTVTDVNGCTTSTCVAINNSDGPELTTSVTDATCGSSNGSIDLSVTGGVGPYTYAWDNGSTTEDLNNLSAGTYCVTVTDANGCSATTCVTVESEGGLQR
ncbi:MAG: SprB repeat-containing protein [Saprospiraceae bacterium]